MFDDEILTAALGAQRLDLIINFARETLDPRAIGISCDNGAAARAIARHALDRGYRRAAILTGPTHVSRTLARATSFRDTMVTAGCPVPAIWSADSLTPEAGRRTVAARLDPASPPQVLFCDTDALALGAIEEIRSRGLRIPRDIGVTGFDDIPFLAQAFDLTTYAQPLAEMSDRVARIVEGSAPEVSDYAFTGTLVVRGSTSARGGQAT